MEREGCFDLLKSWCDGLIRYQIREPKDPRFYGGFFCPACKMIHGRSSDAVYPLMCTADFTGQKKYQDAAEDVFEWGSNMVCDDGSFYNDAQSEWNGITVFGVISLCEALKYHGHLLDSDTRKKWERRMEMGAEWIEKTITADYKTNINYHASAAAALALIGSYLHRETFLKQAKILADHCEMHLLESGLFYGEGQPAEYVTKRGCRPVDIGYNAEESIPSLVLYARTVQNDVLLRRLKEILRKQLYFMLPDGGWDNSFGTRNYKWTYWGSRTSDGCQAAYGIWGEEEPVFHEAAVRNLMLYKQCSQEGLLYGGPHYAAHGEEPCIHHTFCHAKVLASMLDCGKWSSRNELIPSEQAAPLMFYPEIDTWKISKGGFLGTVTGYDFEYMKGGHASGGTLTMLWHKTAGPIIMASMTDYWLKEPHNMQLSLKKSQHQSLVPRLELTLETKKYASCYDYTPCITAEETNGEIKIRSEMELKDMMHQPFDHHVFGCLEYTVTDHYVKITGMTKTPSNIVPAFILPVIGKHHMGISETKEGFMIPRESGVLQINISNKDNIEKPQPIFCLSGGFEAWEFVIKPDKSGMLQVTIQVEEEK